MDAVYLIVEGYQNELSLAGGIDFAWKVMPSFEELDMRGYFTGMVKLKTGGDFAEDAKLATRMKIDKAAGDQYELSITIDREERIQFDARMISADLVLHNL